MEISRNLLKIYSRKVGMARHLVLYREKTISIQLKVHINAKPVICVGILPTLETRRKKRQEEVGDMEDDKGGCQSPAH